MLITLLIDVLKDLLALIARWNDSWCDKSFSDGTAPGLPATTVRGTHWQRLGLSDALLTLWSGELAYLLSFIGKRRTTGLAAGYFLVDLKTGRHMVAGVYILGSFATSDCSSYDYFLDLLRFLLHGLDLFREFWV